MDKFAFVSRHRPTGEQILLADAKGIELIPIGDRDAFTITLFEILERLPDAVGVVVVHPAAACRLLPLIDVGVFENANRAPEGSPPAFFAKAFHIYSL